MRSFKFIIYGKPQQRGSKQASLIPDKKGGWIKNAAGKPIVVARDMNKNSKDWMAAVAQQCGTVMHDANESPIVGAVRLSLKFYFRRPQNHYGSGKNASVLKATAPKYHTTTPDLAKLVRCIEDAMKGIVWVDDKQVCVYGEIEKAWTEEQARAEVLVEELSNEAYARKPSPKRPAMPQLFGDVVSANESSIATCEPSPPF